MFSIRFYMVWFNVYAHVLPTIEDLFDSNLLTCLGFTCLNWLVFEKMFIGHADALSEMKSLKDQIVADPISELSSDDDDDDEDSVEQIIYTASFQELARNSIQYDTVIWLSVSLLLVLAWGVGLIMLLYLPLRRYVLQKDLSSRELYVTPTEIVYKVSRPSFIPFWGIVTIEKHVPLALVIDIIIEQGCLQSVYGVHTFRVESIAHGKAAPVDELQVQGVSDPDILKKVIITAASKISQDGRTSWKPTPHSVDVETLTEGSVVLRSPSKSMKVMSPPQSASRERRTPSRLVLNRLEEINRTVKRLELHFEKSYAPPDSS